MPKARHPSEGIGQSAFASFFPRDKSGGRTMLKRMEKVSGSVLRELKSRAQLLTPALRLGQAGVTPEFLAAFEAALAAKQLVKIKFTSFKEEKKTLAPRLAEETGSQLVQRVGNTAVYYRPKA